MYLSGIVLWYHFTMKKEYVIKHKKVFVFAQDGAEDLLIQPIDGRDEETIDQEMRKIEAKRPYTLVCFCVNDWNRELSPWKAEAVYKDNAFGEGGKETLSFVLNDLIPAFQDYKRMYLGGYSLAGLYCLWAGYQTDVFEGIAACSPSVWFQNWMEYCQTNTLKTKYVYLSLGRKEEKTRHPVMKTVGDNIRALHEIYQKENIDNILEWNDGNHFTDPEGRTAKGFTWLLGRG